MAFKILVVDDEPDLEILIRQRFRKQIKQGDLDFVFARNGEEALQLLKDDASLSVVMSDINMPVMDGLTLLTRLTELNRVLKAVIVSAYGDMENIRTAMNRGAYDFLTKPIDFNDFEVTLRKTIQEMTSIREGIKAREHLTATLQVVNDISSEIQLGPLLQKIMATITNMLNAERSTLFLNDDKKKELYTEVGEGLGKTQIRMPNTMGIAGASFSRSETIRLDDPYNDPRFNREVDHMTGFHTRNLLCVPVVNKQGKTIGVTQVLNKIGGPFTDDDETRLRAFTSQMAVALENATLFNDVQTIKNYNESILEGMPSAVLTFDEEGVIVTCNRAGAHILKTTPEELVHKRAADLFAGPNSWITEKLKETAEKNEPSVMMDAELRLGTHTVSANVTILPLFSIQHKHAGSILMIEDITSEKRMKSMMSRYVDASVADRLLSSEDDILEGQARVATVLFSDIRNFTKLAEELGPQPTVSLLNEYFTIMVDCVQHAGGMLDKFIGDAFMAEFGIPLSHEDDEDRAVRAAIRIHQELHAFNERRLGEGKKPIRIGLGMNTATVVSGNIGSPKRMDYTVIGDGVNLAARLEGACKQYGTGILMSEFTFEKLRGHYQTRRIDRAVVYGKTEPVNIYEVLDYHTEETFPNMMACLGSFADGLQSYCDRKWEQAINAFKHALELNPADPVSAMYVLRCELLKKTPPAEGWNGVWMMESK
jgi:adenylate cyclase